MKNIILRSCPAKAAHLNGASPRFTRPTILLLTFTLLLSGCTTIGNFADDLGKHMPTIGEPCNHWQCITESGQQTSDQIKKREEEAAKASGKQPTAKDDTQIETAPVSK